MFGFSPEPFSILPDTGRRLLNLGPAIPVHVVRVGVEGPLEGPLQVFEEDQVELLFGGGLRLVELEKVRRIFPAGRLLEDPIIF